MMDKLEKYYESQIQQLPEKDQKFFRKLKDVLFSSYKAIKPFLIAFAMFWIFTRIRNMLGHDYVVFALLVIIVILLRMIYSKQAELLG